MKHSKSRGKKIKGPQEGAESAESAANGALSPDGYSTPGFETKTMEMNGYVVRTKTDHARRSENKNKTLTKAFHSAR